jgi:hypothetical protein
MDLGGNGILRNRGESQRYRGRNRRPKMMKAMIVGGVAVGPKTAARLRRINPEAEVRCEGI